jgi:hypothetical protein
MVSRPTKGDVVCYTTEAAQVRYGTICRTFDGLAARVGNRPVSFAAGFSSE